MRMCGVSAHPRKGRQIKTALFFTPAASARLTALGSSASTARCSAKSADEKERGCITGFPVRKPERRLHLTTTPKRVIQKKDGRIFMRMSSLTPVVLWVDAHRPRCIRSLNRAVRGARVSCFPDGRYDQLRQHRTELSQSTFLHGFQTLRGLTPYARIDRS